MNIRKNICQNYGSIFLITKIDIFYYAVENIEDSIRFYLKLFIWR